MRPDSPPDPSFAAGAASEDKRDEFDPATWPPNKRGRPYGVYPTPPGLVRDPSMSLEEAAKLPGRMSGGQPPSPPASAPDAAAGQSPPASPPASAPDAAPLSASAPVSASAGPGRPRPWLRRHERFCQLFVVYGNAAEAAYKAGYAFAGSANQGYRLLKRPEIQARIAELHRALATHFSLDAEVLLGKLEAVYRQAIEAESLSAAARVVELQARMAGHLTSRARLAAAPADDDK